MLRRSASLALIAALAACGGGGGASGVTPSTQKTSTPAAPTITTFSLKLPGQATAVKTRHRFYASQATQGVAIDWSSSNLRSPDFAIAVTFTCPNQPYPAGILSCSTDPVTGGTDYTFQLGMSPGTYNNFTVGTFDAPPVSGAFASGNLLAQGQPAAPVVIAAGVANTIAGLTFYGIPASVSVQPAPGQSHVLAYNGSGAAGFAIVGNSPQTFFAEALDADNYVISPSDPGAPSISLAEAATDSPQYLSFSTGSSAGQWLIHAIAAPSSAGAYASVTATATSAATGSTPVSSSTPITPFPELWTTQEAGSAPTGIFGYSAPQGIGISSPIDLYNDPIANPLCGGGSSNCDFYYGALDSSSNILYAAGLTAGGSPAVYAFSLGAGSAGLTPPASASWGGSVGETYEGLAIDTNHHAFILDNASNLILEAYSTANSAGWVSLVDLTQTADPFLANATSVAVAPSAANIPAALAGSIWVGSSAGAQVFPPFSGSAFGSPSNTVTLSAGGAIGFDSSGYLWTTDNTNIYVYLVAGTPSNPTVTQVATTALNAGGATGTSFGAVPPDTMYFGQGTGELTGYIEYAMTCTSQTSCTIATSQGFNTNAASWVAIGVP